MKEQPKPDKKDYKAGLYEIHYNGQPTEYVAMIVVNDRRYFFGLMDGRFMDDPLSVAVWKSMNKEEAIKKAKYERDTLYKLHVNNWNSSIKEVNETIID